MRAFRFRILDNQGLNAELAANICQISERYESHIQIGNENVHLSAKSLMGLIALQAGEGDILHVYIDGEDEDVAAEGMKEAFSKLFGSKCIDEETSADS